MRAVVQDRYGPAELLRVAEVPRPEPAAGEVLVQVAAASVHADVWHVVAGLPLVLRLMGSGLRRPAEPIPGTDLAGVVEAVGPGVAGLGPGDSVFGEVLSGMQWRNGGAFAEYAVAPAARLERTPAALSFVEAAALPTSALIAVQAVRREARVHPGDKVLVNGAAGGVGMLVVQVAKADGAHVTAVDAGERLAALRSIGADEVVDYRVADYTRGPQRYDVVIDIPGNHPYRRVRGVLSDRGRYVLIGHDAYGAGGHRVLGSMPRMLGLLGRAVFDPHLPAPGPLAPDPTGMRQVADLARRGQLRPLIDRTFPLEQAADAIAYLASGRAVGKVVLTVGGATAGAAGASP